MSTTRGYTRSPITSTHSLTYPCHTGHPNTDTHQQQYMLLKKKGIKKENKRTGARWACRTSERMDRKKKVKKVRSTCQPPISSGIGKRHHLQIASHRVSPILRHLIHIRRLHRGGWASAFRCGYGCGCGRVRVRVQDGPDGGLDAEIESGARSILLPRFCPLLSHIRMSDA